MPRAIAIGIGAIAAVSVWPYIGLVRLWPTSRDAVLWIVRGSLNGWLDWVFTTRHFNVGFRPLTALSYSLNTLVGGYSAPIYRMTDLALHASCVVLVGVAFRRMWPDRPPWGAVVASLLFAVHPAVEHVVPELARRSYSLAVLFGLVAVIVAGAPHKTNARALAAGTFAACAALSHELGVVSAVVVTLILGRVIALVPIAVALAARWVAVGGLGGYDAMLDRADRVAPIAGATWRALGGRFDPPGQEIYFVAVVFGCALFYLWRAVAGRAYVAVGWFALLFLLFLPQGVWFPRQIYPMLAPVALLMALTFVDSVRDRRWAFLVPQLLVVGLLVWGSPLVRGMDHARIDAMRATDRVMRHSVADLSELEPIDRVQLVLPYYAEPEVHALRARKRSRSRPPLGARLVELWISGTVADAPGVTTLQIYQATPDRWPYLEEGDDLVLRSRARSWPFASDAVRLMDGTPSLRLQRPHSELGRAFVYIHDMSIGSLTRVDATQ